MIEKHVCTLESARKLKELGVPQDSLFYWVKTSYEWKLVYYSEAVESNSCNEYFLREYKEYYSAFTAGELGLLLPQLTKSWRSAFGWYCESKEYNYELRGFISGQNTESESRAKCLIYLLENKLMEITK